MNFIETPLPHSKLMEESVLCCFIGWPEDLELEFDRLREDDFYIPFNRRIFSTLQKLREEKKAIDMVTLCTKLDKLDLLEDCGGFENIRRIGYVVPSQANFDSYLQEVQKNGRARRLIEVCNTTLGKLFETDADINAIASDAESEIIKVSQEGTVKDVRYVRDCFPDARAHMIGMYEKDPNALGISTGYKNLDEMLEAGGVEPGKTYVIAARPSIGKTTFILNIISQMASIKKGVFFSLEMSETQCTEKLVSMFGSIDPNTIYAETIEYEQLLANLEVANRRLQEIDLIVDDSSYHFEDLVHRIKLLYVKEGIDFAAIDYLQLMEMISRTDNREQMVAKMSKDLKRLAKILGIPILILAQLSRKSEGKQPILSDLRDSGSIEQDADVVALLHRERADSDELRDKVAQGHALETRLIIAKNRGGKTGPVDLLFFPQYSTFQEPLRIEEQDIPE